MLYNGIMRIRIIKNCIKCKNCGDVIVSEYRHDYVSCSCGRVAVDGGNDYLRRAYTDSPEADYLELSETIEVPE